MRILSEDENHLVFVVYPTKYFLLVMVLLILMFVYALTQPELITDAGLLNAFNINLPPSGHMLVGTIIDYLIIIVSFVILIASYLIPIHVDIDKMANTLTYQYLAYDPIREVGESSFKITKVISINNLSKLVYSNNIPEVPRSIGSKEDPAFAKFRFMLKDNSSVNVYVNFFSVFPHRYAFKKIADYLNIPYENDFSGETKLDKVLSHATPGPRFIQILLLILVGLILLLVLFVGTIILFSLL